MKKLLSLLILFFVSITVANAQMNTDNSYLRKNYMQSKTAKKAAAKKAAKKAVKDARAAKSANSKTAKQKNTAASASALPNSMYLEGAINTTDDGVVYFEKTFTSKTKNKQQLYDYLKSVANSKIEQNKALDISRILSESGDTLVATICEPIYFKRKKWESDSTLIKYQYLATVTENTATVRAWFISYCYEQDSDFGFNYKAEEWITDDYALSKDKLSLLKLPGKFRIKTIDYINDLFKEIEQGI